MGDKFFLETDFSEEEEEVVTATVLTSSTAISFFSAE